MLYAWKCMHVRQPLWASINVAFVAAAVIPRQVSSRAKCDPRKHAFHAADPLCNFSFFRKERPHGAV